jgi:putative PIN family toxin of toxin-antitoxin system
MIYAVIDTNVFVSALFTKNIESATIKVLNALLEGKIVPLYNNDIIAEYDDVLHRPKFHFTPTLVNTYIEKFCKLGIPSERIHSEEHFPDPKDIVFYEVVLSKEDAYLVTGNKKHFPAKPIVVTPAEMVEILKEQGLL